MHGFRPLLGAILLGLSASLSAQSVLDKAAIEEMFGELQEVDWFRTFSGTVDDVHQARLALACAGQICKGRYQLTGSGLTFDLRGTLHNERASLEEIDHSGRISGHLDVELTRDACRGDWWSGTYNRAIPVYFVSNRIVQIKKFSAAMYLMDCTIAGKEGHLILTKETPDVVAATMTFDGHLLTGVGKCDDRPCTQISCPLSTDSDTYATLEMTFNPPSPGTLKLTPSSGAQLTGQAIVRREFPVAQIALEGYSYLIDCAYPVTGNPAFDKWLQEQFSTWVTSVQAPSDPALETLRPALRWSSRGYAWVDLHVFNNYLASGVITTFSMSDSSYLRTPFIYDLQDAVLLSVNAMARKGEDLNSAIIAEAHKLAPRQVESDLGEMSSKLKYICVGTDGFMVHSDFDQVYGDRVILVPYGSVAHLMRRNAITNSILQ